MAMNEEIVLEKKLEALRTRHQELDDEIDSLSGTPFEDQLRITRLKKEKLRLREMIFSIQCELYPDITA